jgi:hypothetical protein
MTLVHNAYRNWLKVANAHANAEWARTHHLDPPKLSLSNLGLCRRQTFYKAVEHLPDHPFHAPPTHFFDDYTLSVMHEGHKDEDDTALALEYTYDEGLTRQWEVQDSIWIGHPDFVIQPDIVVEHKATNAKNFAIKRPRVPYETHCLQVLAYRFFLEKELDRMVYARLYYRTHGHWAEFEVYDCGGFISYEGHVDGRKRSGSFETSLPDEMADHEGPWLAGELPPRKEEPEFPCVKYDKKLRGRRANCQFFGHCWPELPQSGAIEL